MNDYKPLIVQHTFKASSQEVWNAWTRPDLFKQWYMPAPFSVSSCELDVKPGGKISIDTHGPDGTIMSMTGEFKVVEEPVGLVMINSPIGPDGNKLFEIQHTLLLSEASDTTIAVITSEVLSAGPNTEQFLRGMKPGLEKAMDQLADLLAS